MTQVALSPDDLRDALSENDLVALSSMLHAAHSADIVEELSRLRGDGKGHHQ